MRWVIFTDLLSSMLAIENHPILNQIYDILAELYNQGKQIILSKVLSYIGIKRNEEADKAAKQCQGGPLQDYLTQTIRRARNSKW